MAGINWKIYLQAALANVSHQLKKDVKTRPVDATRRGRAESLLPKLNSPSKVYIDRTRALIFFRLGTVEHVALYSWSASPVNLPQQVALANKLGLPPSLDDLCDSFFLFLATKFKLITAPDLPDELSSLICLELTESGATADFDRVRNAHGNFLIWKVSENVTSGAIFNLLTADDSGCATLCYSEGASSLVGIFRDGQAQIVDLAEICQCLISPIVAATGSDRKKATVSIDANSLASALEIKISSMDVAYCVGGGACFPFKSAGHSYLALSIKNSPGFARDLVIDLLAKKFNFKNARWGSEHLIAFLSQLDGSVQVVSPPSSEGSRWLDDQVFSDDDGSNVSDIASVQRVFEELLIFSVEDSDIQPLKVLSELAVNFAWARSPFVPPPIVPIAKELLTIDGFPYENLYLSLSASHWKHCFIEIYRAIEGLYYFAWMHKLRYSLGSQLSEYELSKTCQESLSWKFDERNSIINLFDLIPVEEFSISPTDIECLKSTFREHGAVNRKFGSAIYSIRNSNIHQAEVDGEPIEVTADCWPKLTRSLFEAVRYFYRNHYNGMPKAKPIRLVS